MGKKTVYASEARPSQLAFMSRVQTPAAECDEGVQPAKGGREGSKGEQ
jgi:hypothetical protein